MTADITPLWRRVSDALASAIVRAWPRETRDWGYAFAAELSEISTFSSSGSWLWGGFKMLLKERLRHFWKSLARPFGLASNDSLDASYKTFSRFPRLPRVVVAGLLIASIAILLHPEVRSAEAGLFRSYSLTSFAPHTWNSTHKLRQQLQKNRDPQLLALLSLISTDDVERLRLSNEAIEKDPSLTWLDYQQSSRPLNNLQAEHYLTPERINRLQHWDADNAVTHVLEAEVLAAPLQANTFDSGIRNRLDHHVHKELISNPAWNAAMNRAFLAPRYDNYVPRLGQLVRDVSNRYQIHDSEIALLVLWNSRMIHFQMVHAYADFLFQRAQDAQSRGDLFSAASSYRQILAFTDRMSLNQSLPVEKYFAEGISAQACEKLQPLLISMNRTEESTFVAYQLAHLRESHDMRLMGGLPLHYSNWESIEWSGLQINLAALSIAALFGICGATFLLLWFRRTVAASAKTRFDSLLSLSADSAPLLLFLTCALFYLLYHPYAQICSEFFINPRPSFDMERFVAAAAVVNALPQTFGLIVDPLFHWTTITIALSVLAISLLLHMFYRRKDSAPQPV